MPDGSPALKGLDLDGLLAEGLREPRDLKPAPWVPPTPEELRGMLPRHEIIRLIGRGGMGAVYEARQADLDRRVAVKLLPPELGANEAFVARFRREARALGRLRHPNILSVFEFGQSAADHLFFSMEYVDGGDLASRLRRGPFIPPEALRVVKEICAALESAHAQGVVHRDIKPSNILLTADGTVKVADFGLAVLTDRLDDRLTSSGMAVGTFEYSAPEQAAGTAADSRSDLFSVGVLCYEMLTGQLPRGVFDPPSRVNVAVNPAVDPVVLTAMQKDPDRRYQTAADLRTAISTTETKRPPGILTRRRFLTSAGGALALAAGGLGWRRWRNAGAPTAIKIGPVVFWGTNDAAEGNIPSSINGIQNLWSGWQHIIALTNEGNLVTWGLNADGQTNVPQDLGKVRAAAAGANFTAALKADGTVAAWGNNRGGQTSVPAGLMGVQAIAAGSWHCLALKDDGTVVAWGDNRYQQTDAPPSLKDVKAIAAGNAHSLALLGDGTLVGWGDNIHGQSHPPGGLRDVKAIAAGGFHNLALKADGSLVAWGNNDAGQTILPGGRVTSVQAMAAGYRHSVILKQDGSIIAWGWDLAGQCNLPDGLKGVRALSAGMYHSLALVRD